MARRKQPEVRVTLATFDSSFARPVYRAVREDVELGEFTPIQHEEYFPSGGTPLRDATGKFLAHLRGLQRDGVVTVGLLLDESGSMGNRRDTVIEEANQFVDGLRVDKVDPAASGTVLCVIVTDGEENSSTEIEPVDLKSLVSDCESSGFTMIFMGSGIDAWDEGYKHGFHGSSSNVQSVSYGSTPRSHAAAMASVTSDAQDYLVSNVAYHSHRAGSTSRSVTDSGDEVLSNVNAGS